MIRQFTPDRMHIGLVPQWFTLWFLFNLRSENNSRRAKRNQYDECGVTLKRSSCKLSSCFILAASNRQVNKKKRVEKADHYTGIADGQTDMSCWPILLLPAEKKREEMRAREFVWRWQVSVLLHSVSSISQASEAVIGAVRHPEKDRTHTHTNTHIVYAGTHIHGHTHSCPSACILRA